MILNVDEKFFRLDQPRWCKTSFSILFSFFKKPEKKFPELRQTSSLLLHRNESKRICGGSAYDFMLG